MIMCLRAMKYRCTAFIRQEYTNSMHCWRPRRLRSFVQTLVAMDTCCGLGLIREEMVTKYAIKQYIADARRVRVFAPLG
jgi:hypothetical protein